MTFDHQRARELLDLADRDTAPFFTGRADEIERFRGALRAAGMKEEAVFRVYQGAPGCGKTSLLHYLRSNYATDGVMFVRIEDEHLASKTTLLERIRESAVEEGSTGRKLGAPLVQALGERLRMRKAGERLRNTIAARMASRVTIVTHMDEAQLLGTSERAGLVALHRDGLGLPVVCLWAGLSHTARRLGELGVSRLSRDAVANVGAMSEGECAESTRMMIDRLDAAGTDHEKRRVAEMAAGLSRGWPQHLNGAQTALCRELIRTVGVLSDVDPARVQRESDRDRHAYYEARLLDSVLALRPTFTCQVITKVRERPPTDELALRELCDEELARSGLGDNPHFDVTAEAFATALVEKGVVTVTLAGGCEIAIPSMADWAVDRLAA